MGLCDFSEAKLEDEDFLGSDSDTTQLTPPAMKARVSVGSGGGGGGRVNSVDVPPPTVYYVIVGFGPGAVMNHTTLRASTWGQARIGQLTVMHIGFRNPWPNYVAHGMGQVPFLLSMPGFAVQPNAPRGNPPQVRAPDGGLHSTDFGDAINDQYAAVAQQGTQERHAWVAWVQHRRNPNSLPNIFDYYPENGPWSAGRGPQAPQPPPPPNPPPNPPPIWCAQGAGTDLYGLIQAHVAQANQRNDWPDEADYRLIIVGLSRERRPQLETVYAAYIDFCTGPGRPNVILPAGAAQQTLDVLCEARTPPWLPPEVWDQRLRNRRVLNGVDAIASQVQWNQGERVCLTAGGGVGLNAAEKARNHNCYLDWFGRNSLIGTFANPRNHTFLLDPRNNLQMGVGDLDVVAPFHQARLTFEPHPPRAVQRFGKSAALANAALVNNNQVAVTLNAYRGRAAVLTDRYQAQALAQAQPGQAPPAGSPLVANPNPQGLPGMVWGCSPAYLQNAQHPQVNNWPSERYDRLVIPNGQGANALGQPAKFTEIGQLQWVRLNNRGVALTNGDGLVRLLGAACQVHRVGAAGNWAVQPAQPQNAWWEHWYYHSSLPVSAVPDGFILSGSNIATANGYFVDPGRDNRNINTMTQAEIQALLPQALPGRPNTDYPVIAEIIVGCRNRSNGYKSYLDQQQPPRDGLMTVVNNGQGRIPVPAPVPPGFAAGANDARVDGMWARIPPRPLQVAEAQTFNAVFRFAYP